MVMPTHPRAASRWLKSRSQPVTQASGEGVKCPSSRNVCSDDRTIRRKSARLPVGSTLSFIVSQTFLPETGATSSCLLRQAAGVDGELDASNVTGFVRGQPDDGVTDFSRLEPGNRQ